MRELLPVPTAIDLLEEAFRLQAEGAATNVPRGRIRLQEGVFQHLAAALPKKRAVGLKAYTSTATATIFVVLLFDPKNSELLAILEADWLGRIRTGAASGLATRLLSSSDARTAGVIGAGGQAETQIEALAAVRALDVIKVFSRTEARREALVASLRRRLDCHLQAVTTARAAVAGSDIVTTITTSSEPVFDGHWLAEGCHVNAAGSNVARKREIDTTTVTRANRIIVDSLEQARIESGDLIRPVEEGVLSWENVSELSAIVGDGNYARDHLSDITLYESQGIALEDMIVARHVYDQAIEQGRGQEVEFGRPAQ